MRSILKKIAVRKNYKENISMEAGVDPTNVRMAAYLLVNSANIIYGCLHTRIETTLCRLSAECNLVTKENAAIQWSDSH